MIATRVLFVVLGGLALARCAPPPAQRAAERIGSADPRSVWYHRDTIHVRRVIPAPLEMVWTALPNVFKDLGLPARAVPENGPRAFGTPSLKIETRLYEPDPNSMYLDCGRTSSGAPAADVFQVVFGVMTQLLPHPSGGTEIDILVNGTARDWSDRTPQLYCKGTGELENALVQRLEARLRAPAQ